MKWGWRERKRKRAEKAQSSRGHEAREDMKAHYRLQLYHLQNIKILFL